MRPSPKQLLFNERLRQDGKHILQEPEHFVKCYNIFKDVGNIGWNTYNDKILHERIKKNSKFPKILKEVYISHDRIECSYCIASNDRMTNEH